VLHILPRIRYTHFRSSRTRHGIHAGTVGALMDQDDGADQVRRLRE